jgi:uncharacterized protein (DUF433 family)
MTITETFVPNAPPLTEAEGGTIRVTGTRVSLDTVVGAYKQGSSPEGIIDRYPSLKLQDVYAVIAYYLANQEAVDAYIAEHEREADEIQRRIQERWPNDGIKERLLARRKSG